MILHAMMLDEMILKCLHNSSSQDLRSTIVIALSLRGYSIVGNRKGARMVKERWAQWRLFFWTSQCWKRHSETMLGVARRVLGSHGCDALWPVQTSVAPHTSSKTWALESA
jgi:hypothetical protein